MHRPKVPAAGAVAARVSLAFGALLVLAAAGEPTQDDTGQVAFNTHCRGCHSTKSGDNRLGPSLHGIFGAKAGQVAGFGGYSGSLTPDITWDDSTLDKFIANPESLASGTTMKPFPGVADAGERKKIIDFLKSGKATGNPS